MISFVANALSGVPDGRGGMLPAIKQPPISPMDDRPTPFLASPVGGGPPPLSIQRQKITPGPLIGGRPALTTPSGPLPRSIFTGTTPVRPVRQVQQVLLLKVCYNEGRIIHSINYMYVACSKLLRESLCILANTKMLLMHVCVHVHSAKINFMHFSM